MASAIIIFDNSLRRLNLSVIRSQLNELLGIACSAGEWRFGEALVPQIWINTSPPFALQLGEHPEIVPAEIEELLDDHADSFDEFEVAAARRCRSRIEIVTCEPTEINRLPGGGILSYTPNVDLDSVQVQLALRRIAQYLQGWTYDNINGRWL